MGNVASNGESNPGVPRRSVDLAVTGKGEVADGRDRRREEPTRWRQRYRDRADSAHLRAGNERGGVEPVELVGVQVGDLGPRADGKGWMPARDVEAERRRTCAGAVVRHLQSLPRDRGREGGRRASRVRFAEDEVSA